MGNKLYDNYILTTADDNTTPEINHRGVVSPIAVADNGLISDMPYSDWSTKSNWTTQADLVEFMVILETFKRADDACKVNMMMEHGVMKGLFDLYSSDEVKAAYKIKTEL